MEDLSIVIKTYLRTEALRRCLLSIRDFLPHCPIVVADDSPIPIAPMIAREFPELDITVAVTEMCSGLSRGRNAAVDLVQTRYMLLLDDDMWIDEANGVTRLYELVSSGRCDVAGGAVMGAEGERMRWHGDLSIKAGPPGDGDTLVLTAKPDEEIQEVDIVLNFFVAVTEKIRKIRWNDKIEIGAEHAEFFWRAKQAGVQVLYDASACCQHGGIEGDTQYVRERGSPVRQQVGFRQLLKHHHIRRMYIDWDIWGKESKHVWGISKSNPADHQLVLGLGTGRCGTVSLNRLLSVQHGYRAEHEPGSPWPWYGSSEPVIEWCEAALGMWPKYGLTACYLLPHAEPLFEHFPHAKAVVLQRDRVGTVDSYRRRMQKHKPHSNHFAADRSKVRRPDPLWDQAYPKYPTDSHVEGLEMYWDDYYATCDELGRKYPDRVYRMRMTDLNDVREISKMLAFLGIEEEARVRITPRLNAFQAPPHKRTKK